MMHSGDHRSQRHPTTPPREPSTTGRRVCSSNARVSRPPSVLATAGLLACCAAPAVRPESLHIGAPRPTEAVELQPEPHATPFDHAIVPLTRASGAPLSPLALIGRDVFVREGCHVCHAVVPPGTGDAGWHAEERRPLPHPPSAPDLSGVGGKYREAWHVAHLRDPAESHPGSTMPAFAAALAQPRVPGGPERVAAAWALLAPNNQLDAEAAAAAMRVEAEALAAEVVGQGGMVDADSELVAVIAYLQQLDRRGAAVDARPEPKASDALDAALVAEAAGRSAAGAALYQKHCVPCHAQQGAGLIGPALNDGHWLHGGRPSEVLRSIAQGFPSRGMPAWGSVLGEEDVRNLASYVAVAWTQTSP